MDKKNLNLGNYTSPAGKASYPKLNSPDTKYKAEGEYSVNLVFSEDSPEAKALMDLIDEAHEKNVAYWKEGLNEHELEMFKVHDKPYRAERDRDTKKPTGNIKFKFGMKAGGTRQDKSTWTQQPDLFDGQAKPLPASVTITGGSTIKVSYYINGWKTPQLGAGVSCKLKGVQLIEKAGFNGDAADQGFSAVEGGFSAADTPADVDAPAADQTPGQFA